MSYKQNQPLSAPSTQPTKRSNRQSFDNSDPVDIKSRPIDYLTETEVQRLLKGTKNSRNPIRDELFILMLFHHGLRESEAIQIRRDWLKLDSAQIWIHRLKGGNSSYHPIVGDELRLIRKYLRTRTDDLPWLFISERMQPLSDRSTRVIVANAAKASKMQHVHPHMLRHSCGFYLNNNGYNSRLIQDYLGHVNPSSTALYTRTASRQFEGLF